MPRSRRRSRRAWSRTGPSTPTRFRSRPATAMSCCRGTPRTALEKSTAESIAMKVVGVKTVQNNVAHRPLKAGAGRRRGCRAALRRAGIFVRVSARRRAAHTPPSRPARRGRGHRRSRRRGGSLRADAPPPARRAGPVRARGSASRSAPPRRAGRSPRSSTIPRCAPRGPAANRSGARRRRFATATPPRRASVRASTAPCSTINSSSSASWNSSRSGLAQRSCSSMAIEPSPSWTAHCG